MKFLHAVTNWKSLICPAQMIGDKQKIIQRSDKEVVFTDEVSILSISMYEMSQKKEMQLVFTVWSWKYVKDQQNFLFLQTAGGTSEECEFCPYHWIYYPNETFQKKSNTFWKQNSFVLITKSNCLLAAQNPGHHCMHEKRLSYPHTFMRLLWLLAFM